MRPTSLLLLVTLVTLVTLVKLTEGRGRIDLLSRLTSRRAGSSLLDRIRPSRPTSLREQARSLQQGSDINQVSSSDNTKLLDKLTSTARPARLSLLDRARSRPRRPFLPTRPTRAPFTPKRSSPRRPSPRVPSSSLSNRRLPPSATNNLEQNRLRGDECDALRTENDLLKQLISSVTSQKPSDLLAAKKQELKLSPLHALQQLQGQLQGRNPLPSPLDVLEHRALPDFQGQEVIETTVTKTSVFPSVFTSQTTREISLRFQNKWKTTQVVEAVVVTSTITSLVESVLSITPTRTLAPTLATATLRVPLPSQPTPLRSVNSKIEGSPLSSFQALQRYLLQLRDKGKPAEREEALRTTTPRPTSTSPRPSRPPPKQFTPTRPHLKLPPKRLPQLPPKDLLLTAVTETVEEVMKPSETATESVVTIFVSGSVPGVYSTVLSTITATSSPTVRRKREVEVVSGRHLGISPTPAQHLDATQVVSKGNHLSISPSKVDWQCRAKTITVTVTEMHACDGSVTLMSGGSDSDSE